MHPTCIQLWGGSSPSPMLPAGAVPTNSPWVCSAKLTQQAESEKERRVPSSRTGVQPSSPKYQHHFWQQ